MIALFELDDFAVPGLGERELVGGRLLDGARREDAADGGGRRVEDAEGGGRREDAADGGGRRELPSLGRGGCRPSVSDGFC